MISRIEAPEAAGGEEFRARCLAALEQTFGFESFRPGQEKVLEAMASGRDTVVVMPTGSGKSLCYQVPALVAGGVTLVVSPLIALMKDQVDGLTLRGVRATCINSSISVDEQFARLDALRDGAYQLVYVAPERFRNRSFRRAVAQLDVAHLAVDEAHCISEWGHDFRPDYRRLREVRELLPGVQALALTATATPQVRDDIVRELGMDDPAIIVTGFDRPNLAFRVRRVRGDAQKREALDDILRGVLDRAGGGDGGEDEEDAAGRVPAGVVYTGTRKHAEQAAEHLRGLLASHGKQARDLVRAYHAGLEHEERRRVQEDFMAGKIRWVTATNAFGMGVDKADLRFVVHYDLPGSVEAYYQEVGRAGRDGLPAECVLLFAPADRRLQEFFIEGSHPSRATIDAVHRFLWQQNENPIFRSLSELHESFRDSGLADGRVSQMAFRSAVVVLERAGALERLDRFENLAEIRPLGDRDWSGSPFASAPVKSRVWQALARVFARNEGEPANFHLEGWAHELELTLDSLKRALGQLVHDGWIGYIPPFRGRAIRLPERFEPLDALGIDFESLRERRRRDELQLENMLAFAQKWRCRRDLVLEHFGERAPEATCGRCDVCASHATGERKPTDLPRPLSERETTVVRKALSGVARARGRCGRGRIVQMLVGSRARGVLELGFETLSTYGILRDLPRDVVRELIESLEASGCLRQSGDRYPILELTDLGKEVMRGEQTIEMAFPVLASAAAAERSTPFAEEILADESYDSELFERLRSLRLDLAREHEVPAYRVFNDRTLKAMARLRPRDAAQLLSVPGVGKRTLELFGEAFLRELTREG